MPYNNEQLKYAKEKFKNHQAKILTNDKNIMIIDWRNKNGSSEYYIRYIIDLQMGSFIVQGDCGYTIASWQDPKTPTEIKNLSDSIPYFLSKLKCSSDKYRYDEEDIKNDLNEAKKYILDSFLESQADKGTFIPYEEDDKFWEDFNATEKFDERFLKYLPEETKNEFNQDWEEITNGIITAKMNNNAPFPEEITEILNKYEQDWWENSLITEAGRRIDPRVYLWVYGFQMAMEQLDSQN